MEDKRTEQYRQELKKFVMSHTEDVLKNPRSFIRYPFIDPGSVYDGNVWDWDTYWSVYGFLNLADSYEDPSVKPRIIEHAQGNIRNFFDHQLEDGYIPMMIEVADWPEPYLNMRHKEGKIMNLPNKLTTFRVILIPFFVFFMLAPDMTGINNYIAVAIFIVASLTDLLDGKIARKYNLVTNFGKFMDPLADKLLVCSAMICLIQTGQLAAWIVVIIIAREFIISGFRLIASDNGVVIAASYWGKFKTTFQMLMVIVLILNIQMSFFQILGVILTYVALILTVVSLIDYIVKNKDVLKEQN